MPSRENKDGSVTTWAEDVDEPAADDREAKVVKSPGEQPAAKTRSQAESK